MEPSQTSVNDIDRLVREDISRSKYRVPEIYLIPCEWFEKYVEGDIAVNTRIEEANMEKAVECFTRHNGFIEYYKTID